MNVHYPSRPHKKGYGVLLSLQACSCKAARLGVAIALMEEGREEIFPPSSATHPVTFMGPAVASLQEQQAVNQKTLIKGRDCSSQLTHWTFLGLHLPICEVGLSPTSQRWL